MKRIWKILFVLLVITVFIVFAGGQKEAEANTKKVTIGNSATIWTLDGSIDSGGQSRNIYFHIYDNLYVRDRGDKWQSALALSHEIIDDLTWELSLRKGVKFHTGEEFTAKDVKFTIEHVLDPKSLSKWKAFIDLVDRVEVVDPYTVRIITKEPFPGLINNVALIPILSETAFKKMGADDFGRNPVGTGPYVFEKWVEGEYVTLRENKEHWRGAPPFEVVEFREIIDDFARVAALEAGDVDIIVNVPPDLISRINQKPNLVAQTVPSIRGMYVLIDTRCGPFKDVRVRQAINHFVDVNEFIEFVLGGTGAKPINNMVPPMYFGHNKDLPIEPYPYDPEKAEGLLKKAGYTEPFEIELYGPIGRYLKDRELAQVIEGQLEKHGFKVHYEGMEWGTYFTYMRTRQDVTDDKAVLFILGYGAPHYETITPWNEFLRTGSKVNLWQDEEFTKVLDAALTEMDEDTRISLINKGHQLIVERAPIIFLYQIGDAYAWNERINWTPRGDEMVWMLEASLKE